MNTPYYLIDEAALRRNLEILRGVRERTGCRILLAQKAFSMFAAYPIIAEYLDGATASGLFEARLAAEELQGENHVFSAAYRAGDIPELARLCDHVVFNSCAQLRAYAPQVLAAGKQAGLRINPECSTQEGHAIYDPCGEKSRLGVTRAQFDPEVLPLLSGLHFHTLCEQDSDALEKTLDALEEETGLAPASRPGNGFYDDHAPRGMLLKGYDMARQIRRLKPSVREIAAEVEGYRHRATGKSPHGLCVESMFYLAMGATQLSYAIICAASEPMQWYADNYFKSLSAWRPFYEQYVAFNRGTEPGGIDPYIGPDHALRDTEAGEPSFAWSVAGSGDMIYDMATLGLPFCPDGNHSSALIMDASAVQGLARDEAARLFGTRGILLDRAAWEQARQRRLDTLLTDVPTDSPESSA